MASPHLQQQNRRPFLQPAPLEYSNARMIHSPFRGYKKKRTALSPTPPGPLFSLGSLPIPLRFSSAGSLSSAGPLPFFFLWLSPPISSSFSYSFCVLRLLPRTTRRVFAVRRRQTGGIFFPSAQTLRCLPRSSFFLPIPRRTGYTATRSVRVCRNRRRAQPATRSVDAPKPSAGSRFPLPAGHTQVTDTTSIAIHSPVHSQHPRPLTVASRPCLQHLHGQASPPVVPVENPPPRSFL